jgi:hypothetical protein
MYQSDGLLLDWANTTHKPLAGHVTFCDTGRRTARKAVRFAAGEWNDGAYVCQLIIAMAENRYSHSAAYPLPSCPSGARVSAYPSKRLLASSAGAVH